MKKPIVVAHHGSPGTPNDFSNLKAGIQNDFQFLTSTRKRSPLPSGEKFIFIGYSFGSYEAIKDAIAHPSDTKKIILIAPYVFPSPVSPLKKILLNAPFLGEKILKKVAPSAIEEMLKISASPAEVPEDYRQHGLTLQNIDVLKPSIFEKDINNKKTEEMIQKIGKLNIPVTVIRGEEDQTSDEKTHLESLRKLKNYKEVTIAKAGHALPWTEKEKLLKIIKQELMDTNINKEKAMRKIGYFDGKHKNNNVYSFLEKHLMEIPDQKILSWVSRETLQAWDKKSPLKHDSITVRELNGLVGKIGAGFQKIGISEGDRVIVFIPMNMYLYAAMFALQKIGAIPVFLDSWARRDQLGVSAEAVDPKAIISFEQAYELMRPVKELNDIPIKVCAGPTNNEYTARLEALMQTPEICEVCPVEREHTALITFTTGSSGTPKGADRTHRFLAAQHYALDRHLPYKPAEADLPVFPIFSLNNLAAGVNTILPAIDVGVPADHDAPVLIAQMQSAGVTCTTLSPSLLNKVSAFCIEHNITLDFIRRIITGGAPVSRDNVVDMKKAAPNAEILVLYGSTEVEPMAHIEAQEMIDQKTRAQEDPEWVDDGVNVGKLDSGLKYKFLKIIKNPVTISADSEWGNVEVSRGSVGELIVAGEHVCENYYNNTEAFSKSKIKDHNGTVWHRTGDLGRLDEEGNLWLVGRVHNAIQRGDEYLFPVRAEIILKKLPFAKLTAYLGMPDKELGERTTCVLVPKDEYKEKLGDEATLNQWKSEVKRIMDKNGVPFDDIYFKDAIPMDPRHHSKVEYEVLRQELLKNG